MCAPSFMTDSPCDSPASTQYGHRINTTQPRCDIHIRRGKGSNDVEWTLLPDCVECPTYTPALSSPNATHRRIYEEDSRGQGTIWLCLHTHLGLIETVSHRSNGNWSVMAWVGWYTSLGSWFFSVHLISCSGLSSNFHNRLSTHYNRLQIADIDPYQ